MTRDPIVEEVRRIRKAIMAECGDDPRQYVAHLLKVQAECGAKLVSFRPKPARRLKDAG